MSIPKVSENVNGGLVGGASQQLRTIRINGVCQSMPAATQLEMQLPRTTDIYYGGKFVASIDCNDEPALEPCDGCGKHDAGYRDDGGEVLCTLCCRLGVL
jgi:hypothetical protein